MAWGHPLIEGQVFGIVADRDRFVAVGRANDAPASWISTDGLEWDAVPVPPPTESVQVPPNLPANYATIATTMGGLVRLDETLFSFGFLDLPDYDRPVAWRWTDGGDWEEIVSSSAFYDSGIVTDVVAGNQTLVAAKQSAAFGVVPVESSVWAWTVDAGWVQSNVYLSGDGDAVISDLAWNGNQFIAVGYSLTQTPAFVQVPVVWSSLDGIQWTAREAPSAEGQLCALDADPDGGFLAIGLEQDGYFAWASADGLTWEGVALPGDRLNEPSANLLSMGHCEIVTVADQAVALLHGDSESRAWTRSSEGEWTLIPDITTTPAQYPRGQYDAGLDDTVVMVTHDFVAGQIVHSTLHVGVDER